MRLSGGKSDLMMIAKKLHSTRYLLCCVALNARNAIKLIPPQLDRRKLINFNFCAALLVWATFFLWNQFSIYSNFFFILFLLFVEIRWIIFFVSNERASIQGGEQFLLGAAGAVAIAQERRWVQWSKIFYSLKCLISFTTVTDDSARCANISVARKIKELKMNGKTKEKQQVSPVKREWE